jgi:hypothetical protein
MVTLPDNQPAGKIGIVKPTFILFVKNCYERIVIVLLIGKFFTV